nr:cwf19-like protein [Quercus suber]
MAFTGHLLGPSTLPQDFSNAGLVIDRPHISLSSTLSFNTIIPSLIVYPTTLANMSPTYSAVIGDVNGQFTALFTKLAKLHSTQKFAFAIIAGNLFADKDKATAEEQKDLTQLLNGGLQVPLPTYFALGHNELPDVVVQKLETNSGELCANLTALGRKISFKTTEGFRIVALGGTYVPIENTPAADFGATYTDSDVAALSKTQGEVDFLITSDWPERVRQLSKIPYNDKDPDTVRSVADLCKAIKPRYHFSTSSTSYDREPFYHARPRQGAPPPPVTRFISLAPFRPASTTPGKKWIKAFQLYPAAPVPDNREGFTLSPFGIPSPSSPKRKREVDDTGANLRFRNGNGYHDRDQPSYHGSQRESKRRRGGIDQHRPPPGPQDCYFCFVNPSNAVHMIGSVGNTCYVTVAKGPLPERNTYPQLGFPGHMLIMPQNHAPTLSLLQERDDGKSYRDPAIAEMTQYRNALQTMVADKSRPTPETTAELGAVTWEVSRASGVHIHWQFLPVKADWVLDRLVEAAFDSKAELLRYPKFVKEDEKLAQVEQGDFFKLTMWCESKTTIMVLPLDGTFKFDIQFGRTTMAELLGLENRKNWKECAQPVEEESKDCEMFREAFKNLDEQF